jgi:heat shock protein HtpX
VLASVGLRTHIWNNHVRSLLLLAGFPVLLLLLTIGVVPLWHGYADSTYDMALADIEDRIHIYAGVATAIALVWFATAYFSNTAMIGGMTGAEPVTRDREPRLYNIVETLCISRGMTVPRLRIMETPALNAYASGVNRSQYTVAVTRGLVDTLDDAELEAVAAHELTHIRNADVRLMMVATVFVGIITMAAEVVGRSFRFPVISGRNRRGGNGGVLILIGIVAIAIAAALAIVVRLALSRRPEYMADAGAVELTKNPDAMIAALRKIESHPGGETLPRDVQAMMVHSAAAGLFATHPPIADRIAALTAYAGGRDPGPWRPQPAIEPATAARPGPWSRMRKLRVWPMRKPAPGADAG